MKPLFLIFILSLILACSTKSENPIQEKIEGINSKKGELSKKEDNISQSPQLETFLESYKPKKKIFSVKANEINVLKGDKGTIITVPANTLCFENGELATGKVSIELQEYFSLSEMMSENLTTRSNGKILETGGMFFISAKSNEKNLKISKGKTLQIQIPTKKNKRGMSLFQGKRNANNEINWVLAEEPKNENKDSISEPKSSSFGLICASPSSSSNSKFSIKKRYTWQISREMKYEGVLVDWKYADGSGNFPDNFVKNFDFPAEMARSFVTGNKQALIKVKFNKSGKAIEILVEKATESKYDSLLVDFIRKMPRISMGNLNKIKNKEWFEFGFSCYRDFAKIPKDQLDDFEEKNKKSFTQKVENINQKDLEYYVFNTTELGWINCDRFWENKDQKIDVSVKVERPAQGKFLMVFKGIAAIIAGEIIGDRIVFRGIPIRQKVKIIGIRFNGNKPQLGIKEVNISSEPLTMSDFSDFTLNELNRHLSL